VARLNLGYHPLPSVDLLDKFVLEVDDTALKLLELEAILALDFLLGDV